MPEPFRCTLVTPEQQLFDEQVVYASIPAHDGLMGIEHSRAPLLVKLGHGPLRLDLGSGGSQLYFVGGGFAQMKDNLLTLVTDEALAAEQIDHDEAVAALREAQAKQAVSEDDTRRKDRDLARARGMLALAGR